MVTPACQARSSAPLAISPRALAGVGLAVATGLWDASVAIKPLLPDTPPLTLAALRFAVALLVLLPLLRRSRTRPARLGLAGGALLRLFQNVGLRWTGAASAPVIMGGGFPLVAGFLAAAKHAFRPHALLRKYTIAA